MPQHPPPSDLSIMMGGMHVTLEGRAAQSYLPASLRSFVVAESAKSPSDLRIQIKRESIPPVRQLGECFYDSQGIFAMYRLPDGTQTISFRNAFIHDPTLPYQIARFDPDFRTCRLSYEPRAYQVARSTGDRSREALAAFETPLDEILCISLLGRKRGLMLHASAAIMPDGRGAIFVGHSGAGKSTLARLCHAAGWQVLSDERVIVRPYADGWHMYGTPWVSSARLFAAAAAPLAKLFLLQHAPQNTATPVDGMAAIAPLIGQSCPPLWSQPGVEYTLSTIERLSQEVACYSFGFVPDTTALAAIVAAPTR